MLVKAIWFTFRHFFECPICRWNWRGLLHDLRLSELRYVARSFWS